MADTLAEAEATGPGRTYAMWPKGKAVESSLSTITKVAQEPINFEAADHGELLLLRGTGDGNTCRAKPSEERRNLLWEGFCTLRW